MGKWLSGFTLILSKKAVNVIATREDSDDEEDPSPAVTIED